MRPALFEGPGSQLTVVDDVEVEEPHAGEVRVRVSHCGVCHSDLHAVEGLIPFPVPAILGHEAAGTVDAVGPGVLGLVPGDKVILTLQPSCGRCAQCARGSVHLCTAMQTMSGVLPDGGSRLAHGGRTVYRGLGLGGFAEQVVTPASGAVKVPEDTPLDIACLLGCAVQTGVGAVLNTAKAQEGDTVVVVGLGGVGISAVQGARIAGAARVVGVDPLESRREQAQAFGCTDVLDPAAGDLGAALLELTGGLGADVAIDTAARPETIDGSILGLRAGGTLVVVGVPGFTDSIQVPTLFWALQEKKVTGSYLGSSNPHREFPRLLALWQAGKLDLEAMVTRRRPLDELGAAFDDLKAGVGLRTVIAL